MLCERGQAQKDIAVESRTMVARGRGGEWGDVEQKKRKKKKCV